MPRRRALRFLVPVLGLLCVLFQALPAWAGYTHYWRWHARPDAVAVGRCADDMSRLVEARRGLLADELGRTQSAAVFRGTRVFGDLRRDGGDGQATGAEGHDGGDPAGRDGGDGAALPEIRFNGIGDDGHEAFGFPLAPFTAEDPSFQFVKTAGKPYDEVVVACLIAARDCFPREVLTISSDGAWDPDWSQGAALYERVLGRKASSPLAAAAAPPRPPGLGSIRFDPRSGGNDGGAPQTAKARKRLLLGIILVLGLAIAFVMTREAK